MKLTKLALRTKIAKEVVSKLTHNNDSSILLNGSVAWGSNKHLTQSSDVDLDIIFNESIPKIEEFGEEYERFRTRCNKLLSESTVHYGSWKSFYENIKVSFHFIPIKLFENVCNFDFLNLRKTISIREYRIKPKEKKPIYIQKSFWGDKLKFVSKIHRIDEGIITETPFAILHKGKYYNGLLIDKYMSYPIVHSKDTNIYYLVFQLKKNLLKRMRYETKIFKQPGAKLSNLLHAKGRMPNYETKHLDLESEVLNIFI